MSSQQAQSTAPAVQARQDAAPRSRPIAWLPLILVLVVGATYGLFLVLPYYVNDLDQFPLEEVASGAHDPKDLWPYRGRGRLSVIWAFGALFTVMLGPFILLAAPLWAALLMWRDRRALRVREWCALAMAILCGVALITELASPFHDALVNWWLD